MRAVGIEVRQSDLIGFNGWFGSTSMGGLLPMPPSSAYCVQKSCSISSAAAGNRRMAASPGVSGLEGRADSAVCANSLRSPRTVASATAAPAARLPLRKERRSLAYSGLPFIHHNTPSVCAYSAHRSSVLCWATHGLEADRLRQRVRGHHDRIDSGRPLRIPQNSARLKFFPEQAGLAGTPVTVLSP